MVLGLSTTMRLLRDDGDDDDDSGSEHGPEDEMTQTNHNEHGSTGNSRDSWYCSSRNTRVSPNSGSF